MKVCSHCRRCFPDSEDFCADEGSSLAALCSGSTEMVAGYRLDRLIHSEFQSDLFQAEQLESGHRCLITIRVADADRTDEFLRQARAAAGILHTSLVNVYEAGTLDGERCFVVAEDPLQNTLRDRLADAEPLPLSEAIAIARQAAEALYGLHSNGFLHRAVRPENILLTTDADGGGLVRFQHCDFGGLAEHSALGNKFLIDSAVDSLRYFAPEQCGREPVSECTDIYALGIVLYEMLAGHPPFNTPNAADLLEKQRNMRPPEINIPSFELRQLITHTLMESLHKRPDRRQASANTFARQLRHIEQLSSHSSTPPPAIANRPVSKTRTIPTKVSSVTSQYPAYASTATQSAAESSSGSASTPPKVDLKSRRFGGTIASFVVKNGSTAIGRLSFFRRKGQENDGGADSSEGIKFQPTPARILTREHAAEELEREMASVIAKRSGPPRKIEWIQPDDDVPGLLAEPEPTSFAPSAVTAYPSLLANDEPPVTTTIPPPPPVTPTAEIPEGPASGEPQIADGEPAKPALARVAENGPRPVHAVEVSAESTLGTSRLPAAIRPSVPLVPARRAPGPISDGREAQASSIASNARPVVRLRNTGIRISGLKANSVGARVVDTEEITQVPATPSRFRVNIDGQGAERRKSPPRRVVPIPSEPAAFSLTLLGETEWPEQIGESGDDTIFSTYSKNSVGRSLSYKRLAVGACICSLILIGILGSDRIFHYAGMLQAAEPVAAKSEEMSSTKTKTSAAVPGLSETYPRVTPADVVKERPSPTLSGKANSPKPAKITHVEIGPPDRPAPDAREDRPKAPAKPKDKSVEPTAPGRGNGATRPRIVPEVDQ